MTGSSETPVRTGATYAPKASTSPRPNLGGTTHRSCNNTMQEAIAVPETARPDAASGRAKVLSPLAFHQAIGEVIGKNRIYELLRANRLRHVKIGSRYLILRTEIDDFFVRESETGMGF